MAQQRNIALCIILSFITCGIYGIYWFVKLNDELCSETSSDDYQISGVVAFLLSIVTCGIYGIYWNYKMGHKVDMLKNDGQHAVLFIILAVFGLSIVNYCIMQSALNSRSGAAY